MTTILTGSYLELSVILSPYSHELLLNNPLPRVVSTPYTDKKWVSTSRDFYGNPHTVKFAY